MGRIYTFDRKRVGEDGVIRDAKEIAFDNTFKRIVSNGPYIIGTSSTTYDIQSDGSVYRIDWNSKGKAIDVQHMGKVIKRISE